MGSTSAILNGLSRTPAEKPFKMRWSNVKNTASQRETTWLNYHSTASIQLHVKPPDLKRFRNRVAFLSFAVQYDEELKRFMFQCRLENQDKISEDLDEYAHKLAKQAGEDQFPGAYLICRNTAILFRRELNNDLHKDLSTRIENAARLVEQAVDQFCPDSDYVGREEDVDDASDEDASDNDDK